MSDKTHWLQNPNKNYLGHWDLPETGEMMVTIKSAQWEEVENPVLSTKQKKHVEAKRVIRFEEDIKPLICNQTNAQSVITVTGINFMEDSPGQMICLYVGKHYDKFAKQEIDCVRIKGKPSISLEDVIKMWEEKEILVTESDADSVRTVIENQDTSKYQRVYNFLSKLKA